MDTMLGASDLVRLTVQDVRKRNRVMRETLELSKTNGGGSLRCVISETTRRLLEKWIKHSDKKPRENLFNRRVGEESTAISTRALSRLVKAWAEEIGLDASLYGTESLRRTRTVYLLNRTGNVEAVRILLGLRTISATAQYLSDSKPVDALAISRAHEI
jgi:integrase